MKPTFLSTIFLCFIVALVLSSFVQGEVIEVTTTQDQVQGSLRYAIHRAVKYSGDDTIILPPGLYILTGAAKEDENSSGDLDIDTSNRIEIIGREGSDHTFIDGNDVDRVLHIIRGTVVISGITIQNGRSHDNEKKYKEICSGGGVYNAGYLIMVSCVLTGNKGRSGGGIYNSGNFTATDCTIDKNYTVVGGHGGGIHHENGNLLLRSCTISNNFTGDGVPSPYNTQHGGYGGGIYSNAYCRLVNCTVSTNHTGNGTGGVSDSQVLGSGGFGGGIYTANELHLESCTVCLNSTGIGGIEMGTPSPAMGCSGEGGGIFSAYVMQSETYIFNTIIANNKAIDPESGNDYLGEEFFSQGFNLIKDTYGWNFLSLVKTDLEWVDPMLGPLAYNGGLTRTHVPLPGSPVLDAGNSGGLTTDQRGFTRPVDIPGEKNVGDGSDIGAVEMRTAVTISGRITADGSPVTGQPVYCNPGGGAANTDVNGYYSIEVPIPYSGSISTYADGVHFSPAFYTFDNLSKDRNNIDFYMYPIDVSIIKVDRSQLNFGTDMAGHVSEPQQILITDTSDKNFKYYLTGDAAWIDFTPGLAAGTAMVTVSVDTSGLAPGTYRGVIRIRAEGDPYTNLDVKVTLTVYSNSDSIQPFGSFDLPVNGATVSGSIPVTGWALDNIGLEGVEIYRDPIPGESSSNRIFVGNAIFVRGARPDIETAFPDYPGNSKAGWGYMMLTHGLPDKGNRTYRLHAVARDAAGNIRELGTKEILCDNANAVKPFGTIDLPRQGETVSGSAYANHGWTLTPPPNIVPIDGSTIRVWIDGKVVGQPFYNKYRKDIATLFPEYLNSNGAVGYFFIDTAQYQNGIHTIQWTVKDDAGNTDGIGSRFFYTDNTGIGRETVNAYSEPDYNRMQWPDDSDSVPVDTSLPVSTLKGFNRDISPENVYAEEDEIYRILISLLQPIELRLEPYRDPIGTTGEMNIFSGYLDVNGNRRRLPAGSSFNETEGIFYWQPGPGFAGEFHFIFIKKSLNGKSWKKQIMIRVIN